MEQHFSDDEHGKTWRASCLRVALSTTVLTWSYSGLKLRPHDGSQSASNPCVIHWPLCNSVIMNKLALSFHVLICDHLCKVICTYQA